MKEQFGINRGEQKGCIYVSKYVTFGVCMYSLAGLLIAVLLWVLFTSVTYVVIATHAG